MIIDYPCSLKKENLGIRIKGYDYINSKPITQLIDPDKESEIVLSTGISTISTGIFKLNPNLTISIFNKGKPSHFIIPLNNLPKILRNEEYFYKLSKYKKRKLAWIFCKAVCRSRIKIISRLNEIRNNPKIKKYLDEMRVMEPKLRSAKSRLELMGIEGNITRIFYSCLCELSPIFERVFNRRNREDNDIVNSLMNYGHTILRNRVNQRLILNGLNTYHSFLHSKSDRFEPSLSFDFSEFWIAHVDKLIFYALEKSIIKENSIDKYGRLDEKTRKAISRLINTRITDELIDLKINEFIVYLKGKNKIRWL